MQNRLTDRKLQSLKRRGKRYEVMDSDVPGFGVRVSEGAKEIHSDCPLSWKSKPDTSRAGRISIHKFGEARERAKDWRALIRKGIDPKAEEARLRA